MNFSELHLQARGVLRALKSLAATASLCCILLTLTGCLAFDYTITIQSDGSGIIAYRVLADQQFSRLSAASSTVAIIEDMRATAVQHGFQVAEEHSDGKAGFSAVKKVSNVPLILARDGGFGILGKTLPIDPGSNLKVTRGLLSATWRMVGDIDLTMLSPEAAASPDAPLSGLPGFLYDSMQFTLRLTMPIPFAESNASEQQDGGRTQIWRLKPGVHNPLQASVVMRYSPVYYAVLTALMLVLVLLAARVWLRRAEKEKKKQEF
ncbi:MAG: DUF3153 domain-containing protein [Spirochaetaceae bacterium]|nr:DUF3153 domain-containing protein [Spirochaetaceae bacterium]